MIPEKPFDSDRVYEIDMTVVYADENFNCRGIIDPTTVIELAKDIKSNKLTQPIIVAEFHDPEKPKKMFKIIAGFRRYKAHLMNKADTIRALIHRPMSELQARVLNLTENLQRENLNVKQEAYAIDPLRRAGWGEGQVATQINKSRGWVQTRFKFMELPEDIQDEIAAGLIPSHKILPLASLEHGSKEQYEFVKRIKDQRLLGKKKSPKISDVLGPANLKKPRSREEIFEMQDLIRGTFGHNNFATRVLGWASGEVSDLDVHREIQQQAVRAGKFYQIPDSLEGTHAKTAPALASSKA